MEIGGMKRVHLTDLIQTEYSQQADIKGVLYYGNSAPEDLEYLIAHRNEFRLIALELLGVSLSWAPLRREFMFSLESVNGNN